MKLLNHTKKDDLHLSDKGVEIDLSPFLGTWKNTKPNSGQIIKIVMEVTDGQLTMHSFGAGANGSALIDWGKAKCRVFSDGVNSITANAFFAKYTFDFMDVEISSNVKYGVLVVQAYSVFKDASQRVDYYTREFYGPEEG